MAALIPSASASGSGTMTLAGPSTNANQTVTIPDATGTMMVSGNMPAFSAYPSSTFNISSSTWTIVPSNTEEFDTNSNFNNTGSTVGSNPAYSFQPTVAGYYQVNGTWSLGAGGATFTRSLCGIYKNGSLYKQGLDTTTVTATGSNVSALVYLNGSTDYIGFYVIEVGTGTHTVNSGPSSTWFQASMVRSA